MSLTVPLARSSASSRCSGHPGIRKIAYAIFLRPGGELNPRIKVLQTFALPLGYQALYCLFRLYIFIYELVNFLAVFFSQIQFEFYARDFSKARFFFYKLP